MRVGGAVQSANLISQVAPIYPPLAKQARIQGEVVLEAVISREGDVTNLRVVSGHPLLVEAALTAARQWKYKPTLLNGQPVEVVSQVTVPFKLEPENYELLVVKPSRKQANRSSSGFLNASQRSSFCLLLSNGCRRRD